MEFPFSSILKADLEGCCVLGESRQIYQYFGPWPLLVHSDITLKFVSDLCQQLAANEAIQGQIQATRNKQKQEPRRRLKMLSLLALGVFRLFVSPLRHSVLFLRTYSLSSLYEWWKAAQLCRVWAIHFWRFEYTQRRTDFRFVRDTDALPLLLRAHLREKRDQQLRAAIRKKRNRTADMKFMKS